MKATAAEPVALPLTRRTLDEILAETQPAHAWVGWFSSLGGRWVESRGSETFNHNPDMGGVADLADAIREALPEFDRLAAEGA